MDIERVRERLLAGETFRALASEMGVHERTLRRLTGPIGRPRGRRPSADVRAVVRLRQDGLTQQEIADRLGVSRGAVGRALRRPGGEKSPPSPPPAARLSERSKMKLRALESAVPNRGAGRRMRDWSSIEGTRLLQFIDKQLDAGVHASEISHVLGMADITPVQKSRGRPTP